MTMVFVALTLTVLMVFAAFAVDIGAALNARRQDQSVADASALAAAQDLGDDAAAVMQAKEYAEDALNISQTDPLWNSCNATNDPGALAERASGASCVSFDVNRKQVRVKIPDRDYGTTFGRVVGVETITHSASAVAGTVPVGFGGVLPYGLPTTGGDSGLFCLKSGSNPILPCTGPASGNFGFLSFTVHGPERARDCAPSQDIVTINNTAIGVDHRVGWWTGPGSEVEEDGPPPCVPNANGADGDTGNVSIKLGAALFSGGLMDDGLGPRLRRGNFGQRVALNGGFANLDDNPLWRFIGDEVLAASADAPEACQRDQFVDGSGSPDLNLTNVDEPVRSSLLTVADVPTRFRFLLARCFEHYQLNPFMVPSPPAAMSVTEPAGTGCAEGGPACTAPVFTRNSSSADDPDLFDIQHTPRFGYVPELVNITDPTQPAVFKNGSNNPNYWSTFRPIFIQAFCQHNSQCNPSQVREPGFSQTGTGDSRANDLASWVFDRAMLPGDLGDPDAPFTVGKNLTVRLIR